MTATLQERIRVDKWLWHARFFKSRTLAAKLAGSGKLRINREVVRKPGAVVKSGDVLTFPKGTDIRVIKILALGERRGPASEAQTLYQDLTPAREKHPQALRFEGKGRPTKQDRRNLDLYNSRTLE